MKLASNSNITKAILSKVDARLYMRRGHPLNLVKRRIESFFDATAPATFESVDSLSPVVSVRDNFDALRVPADHVSRSRNDTYYVDDEHVLRCHTSAHQRALLASGRRTFLCTGDVYRCDTIDATHYPVFHQMEGVRLFERAALGDNAAERVVRDLKHTLGALATALFGARTQRWVDAYFPFTEPSLELELYMRQPPANDDDDEDAWLELLGCGVIHPDVLEGAGVCSTQNIGWAFGLGLERIAMAMYGVPDIRLFWSNDARFHEQFAAEAAALDDADAASPLPPPTRFAPFSRYPAAPRDVSLWLLDEVAYHEHQVFEVVREFAGDLAERVERVDEFVRPTDGRRSVSYRVTYRSMERSLLRAEVDEIQMRIRDALASRFRHVIELR